MGPQPSPLPVRWRFGAFELNAATHELRKSGLRIRLPEQPARILEALVGRPGELVSREELRDRLWPGETFVDFERSLNVAVAKLRQTLGDSAEQPRYIETVARRGYRFVALVEASPAAGGIAVMPPVPSVVEEKPVTPGRKVWIWAALGAGLALLTVFAVWRMPWRAAPDSDTGAPPARFVVAPPEGTTMHPVSAVSPDGSSLAFVAMDRSGNRTLWLRPLASDTPRKLDNTNDAIAPFFSPDSRTIGYFAEGKLKSVPATGGSPRTICEVNQPGGGTWSRDNIILFAQSGRLFRVPAAGGAVSEIPRPEATAGETVIDTWPQFLPDGDHFIVSTAVHHGIIESVRKDIFLGSIQSSGRKLLVSARSRAALTTSGSLLFRSRGNSLTAQRIDLKRGQLVGAALEVAENLNVSSGNVFADVRPGVPVGVSPATFSVSSNGSVLVFHSSLPPNFQPTWFDRNGKRLGTAGEARGYMQVFVSPDEKLAVLSARNGGSMTHWNLWLLRLNNNVVSQLSFGKSKDGDVAWGPKSDRVVYGRYRADQGEQIDVLEQVIGERDAKVIYADGSQNKPEGWSPDGGLLLVRRTEHVVYSLPMSGDKKPTVLIDTPHFRGGFRFSPDAKWVAYLSTESGRGEIYVSRFPTMTDTQQVSVEGGFAPLWRKDGTELFYITLLGELMAVAVKRTSNGLETSPPRLLFRVETRNQNMPQYGVTDNGRRFLVLEVVRPTASEEKVVVMTNWQRNLRQ